MEPEPRRLQVDVSKLDLDASLTEALRLLAAAEGGVEPTYLHEAARIVSELFDQLHLDAVDDETVAKVAHRVVEVIAGLTIAGYGAVSVAADALGTDGLARASSGR